MTRDDIIRMAREAGFGFMTEKPKSATHMQCGIDDLERFAALVAAAEREAMIEQGWRQCAKGQRTTQFCGMVEQAVLAEREACAKVVENHALGYAEPVWAFKLIDTIRARGQA